MNNDHTIWVADDDRSIRWVLEKSFEAEHWQVRSFSTGAELLSALATQQPNVVVSDVKMPGMNGQEMMTQIHKQHPGLPVIIMTAHSDLDSAVSAFQQGAFDYLAKPFDIDDMVALVRRALQHLTKQATKKPGVVDKPATNIIGSAPAMQGVFKAIGKLSQSHITVLIQGASGTGKELVAKALHVHSPRASHPFIALNMAAIPRDLIESELFGHQKGAFTGASQHRIGRFEQAEGGTLFLDEIGDMPMDAQTRLLRVLSDGEIHPVGAHTGIRVNVRILAATHQDLTALVRAGKFREDLYHRLNVIRIQLPSLSERREDIPELLQHFLAHAAKEQGIRPKTLKPDCLDFLCDLQWPGNVRQLENTCRWISVMASGNEVHIDDLPTELVSQVSDNTSDWQLGLRRWATRELARGATDIFTTAEKLVERNLLQCALDHTGGRKVEAAKLLGWGRNTLTRKLKEQEE
jgi:two-component system nitrogen regulation response regulator GlnG